MPVPVTEDPASSAISVALRVFWPDSVSRAPLFSCRRPLSTRATPLCRLVVEVEEAVRLVRLWEQPELTRKAEAEPRFTAEAPIRAPERVSVTPCTVTMLGVIRRPPPSTCTSAAERDSAAVSTR